MRHGRPVSTGSWAPSPITLVNWPTLPVFYKGIQSAGAAIVYGLDNAGISYSSMLASNWGLLAGSLVIAAPVILFKVTDHVSVEQDLKFSDETEDEIIGTTESENEGEEEKK